LSQGAFPGFVQNPACVRRVAGQPEVGPAQPPALPIDGWWCLAEQIDGKGGPRPGWERLSQTAAPDEPTRWQAQHASAGGVPRVSHEATLGKRCSGSASPAGIDCPMKREARASRQIRAFAWSCPGAWWGGRGIGGSRERRAWAGGGFLVRADGGSVEAADRHPPGGWAKGRSACLCR
jgi:hypothetical protein